MNKEIEAYEGELRELREERVVLLDENARLTAENRELQLQVPKSEYMQAQIDYDRFS
jgi:regulator of replication initiation timing